MSDYQFEEEEFSTQFNGQTLARILRQARPHRGLLVGFLLSIIAVAGLDSYFTFLGKRIIDEGILAGNFAAALRLGSIYGGLIFVQAVGVFVFIYMTGLLGERVQYDLRQRMFDHLQGLSFSYFDRTPVGWIISRVTSDSTRIADLLTWGLLDTTWAATSILFAGVFMVIINWRLALVVFTVIPVLLIVAGQFKKRILDQFRLVRKLNSKITGAYNESISGVRVSKAFGREDRNLQEFSGLTGEMYSASYRAAWLSALFLPVVQLISAVAIGSIAWFGGLQARAGFISIGGIQAFVSYVTFMLWPIQEVARVYAEIQQSIASAERVFSLVDAEPEVVDRPGAEDPGTLRGVIEFRRVDFYYEEGKPVYENFNLRVEQGETLALVGPTGGGKSTLVNLLARFYEPRSGSILINGRDYREMTLHALQSRIGMVLQTPHLFSGSIRENIRYGKLDADDTNVEAAAQLAGAHDFIRSLPRGYNEDVGEGGNLLSVGQKQLISLARAVLSDPEIIIMDEATSSVDTMTEAWIQQGMEALMRDRTSFIIAHRLSTIKNADRILVIDGGEIVEAGTHAELLCRQGPYYRLYTKQFRDVQTRKYDPFQLTGAPAD